VLALMILEMIFVVDVDGNLLYVVITPEDNENWSAISHTGDTYTNITPSGTETWSDVTHTGDTYTNITPAPSETWTDTTV